MPITVAIFDAYGTLFDVSAAARAAAGEPGMEPLAGTWRDLAATWRDKQLQYTWLRAATGRHADFAQVTADALDWALEAAGLNGETAMRDRLLVLYQELAAYPETPAALAGIRETGRSTGILSNGTPEMLAAATRSAGIAGMLDAVLSVEEVGVYKPDRRVYDLVGARFGCAADEVLFVSANGWDAAAAADYGFRAVWVNRAGAPRDRLPGRPAHMLPDLAGLPDLVETL